MRFARQPASAPKSALFFGNGIEVRAENCRRIARGDSDISSGDLGRDKLMISTELSLVNRSRGKGVSEERDTGRISEQLERALGRVMEERVEIEGEPEIVRLRWRRWRRK